MPKFKGMKDPTLYMSYLPKNEILPIMISILTGASQLPHLAKQEGIENLMKDLSKLKSKAGAKAISRAGLRALIPYAAYKALE